NRTRTLLSLLGITIGIITIIGVFSAVDTLRSNLEGSVEKLGSRSVYIQKWPWGGGGEYPWWKYANRPNPEIKDYLALKEKLTTASATSLTVSRGGLTIKYLNNNVSGATVSAGTHEIYQIQNIEIEDGRYFTESESSRGTNVAIIGATIAEGLFPQGQAVGKSIQMMGRRVTVIGVMKKEGEGMLIDVSNDNTVFVPFNFFRNVYNYKSHSPTILVKAKDEVELKELESEITGYLRSIRRLSPTEEDDFSLNK